MMMSEDDICRYKRVLRRLNRRLEREKVERETMRKKRKNNKEVDLGNEDKSEKRKKKNAKPVTEISDHENQEKEPKNGAVAAAKKDDSSHDSHSDEEANAPKKNATDKKKVETCDEESDSDEEETDSSDESSEEEEESSSDDEESESESEDDSSEKEDEPKTAKEDEPKTAIESEQEAKRYIVAIYNILDDDVVRIDDALRKHFAHCGDIIRTSVPKDYETGVSSGVAFIEFADSEAYDKAMKMNQSDVCGDKIFVIRAWARLGNARGTGWSWVHDDKHASAAEND